MRHLKLFTDFPYSQITIRWIKRFSLKLLLILLICKLAIKRDMFVISKTKYKNPKIPIHSSQVDKFVCTPNFYHAWNKTV